MKFLRSKAAVIFIVIISALCLVAAVIAIDISIVMIKKKDQALKPEITQQQKDKQVSAKPVKANKLEEQEFYFNGQAVEGMKTFQGDEDSLFIPVDMLLKSLDVKYRYFAPDDILEFALNGKKVTIKLNQLEATVGGEKVKLGSAVQAAKNHILIPGELLDHLDGFGVTRFSDSKTTFINYFPGISKEAPGLNVLKITNGVAGISGILGDVHSWKSREDSMGDDRVISSYSPDNYMVKALNKVFIIRDDNNAAKPQEIKVDLSAAWSADGKYLYWIDRAKNKLVCYNTKTGTAVSMPNYFSKVKSNSSNDNSSFLYEKGGILYNFIQGNRFKRVILTNSTYSWYYAFIERRGKTVIEGRVTPSPDHKKILYYENNKGFYTSNMDGSGKKFVGKGTGALWINNNKIMLYTGDGYFVVSRDGEKRTKSAVVWKKLGETPGGDVFYSDGSTLYCETAGKEIKLSSLPVPWDYIFGAKAEGPYIAVSDREDIIYLIDHGTANVIGHSSELIKGNGVKNPKPWGNSMSSSPNGKAVAIARKLDGLINIDILDGKSTEIKNLKLNYIIGETDDLSKFNMTWLKDDELVAYTADRGWLIKLGSRISIYNWVEDKDSEIEAILLK